MQTDRDLLVARFQHAVAVMAWVYSRKVCAEMRASIAAASHPSRQLPNESPLWRYVDTWRRIEPKAYAALCAARRVLDIHDDAHQPRFESVPGALGSDGPAVLRMLEVRQ